MSVIEVQNVSKTFRRNPGTKLLRQHLADWFRRNSGDVFYALKDVSFEVRERENVAIIGGNGAGKSTLLSLIVGLAKPDEGAIRVNGRVAALLELGSGFHPDLTGEENVYLNASLLGFSEGQARELFEPIVEFSEIGSFIREPLRTYSAGMVMRLAFSVAVNVDPAILVIDEVLGVGDTGFQEKCFRKICDLRDRGRTLLCASHSTGTVLQLCDRAIWLDRGEVIMDGAVGDTVAAYEEYITSPDRVLPAKARPPRVVAAAAPVPPVRIVLPRRRSRGERRT